MTSPPPRLNSVAIAIPAFKAASTIGETLDALQANPALSRVAKVVLLDDCSPDHTTAVAQRHWRSQVPLVVWNNTENMGERRTTNAAIARLVGEVEWTFILHADDVVKSNWLSLYFDELEKMPASVASICSSYDNWWPDVGKTTPGEEFPDRLAVHVPGDRAGVLGTLEKGCWWHLSGCGLRNRAFLDIGGFEPDMPQLGDWDWLLRCLSKGYGIWYLPRSTMLYRQHSGSISSGSFRQARDLRERLRVFRSMTEQGYLSPGQHRTQVRSVLAQLTRRSLVRIARGDAAGLRWHAALLAETSANYLRRKL